MLLHDVSTYTHQKQGVPKKGQTSISKSGIWNYPKSDKHLFSNRE